MRRSNGPLAARLAARLSGLVSGLVSGVCAALAVENYFKAPLYAEEIRVLTGGVEPSPGTVTVKNGKSSPSTTQSWRTPPRDGSSTSIEYWSVVYGAV